jgi:hypothetical protein
MRLRGDRPHMERGGLTVSWNASKSRRHLAEMPTQTGIQKPAVTSVQFSKDQSFAAKVLNPARYSMSGPNNFSMVGGAARPR